MDENRGWNLHEAALHGSSHYDLPLLLRWFTANIGIHHVHLAQPHSYYRLPRAARSSELRNVGRLTLLQSFRCVRLVLWDEHSAGWCLSAKPDFQPHRVTSAEFVFTGSSGHAR